MKVVLELDKNNEKAWFRHGQACVQLLDFETAKESFGKVIGPGPTTIHVSPTNYTGS